MRVEIRLDGTLGQYGNQLGSHGDGGDARRVMTMAQNTA